MMCSITLIEFWSNGDFKSHIKFGGTKGGQMDDIYSIMIYHKFNYDFKSHINFGRIKGGQGDDM
jgi:hypothetical protein